MSTVVTTFVEVEGTHGGRSDDVEVIVARPVTAHQFTSQ